jgi:lauroyl/myristoyl acyltransferase
MSNQQRREAALTLTRLFIAILFLVAIWTPPGLVSNICASVGTFMWLFLSKVMKIEHRLINKHGARRL